MKLSSFIIISLIFISFTLKKECKDFQEGTFELDSADGSSHIITRKDNKQIENSSKTGTISEFEIKWLDDCSYILFNRKITKGTDLYPESNSDTLINEVIEINGDFYKVKSTMKGYDFESESIQRRIK